MITTRARACAGKIRHDSKATALLHVVRLSRRGAAFWRLSAYRCKSCDGWHVGHKAEPKRCEVRPHSFLPDSSATDRFGGDPRCMACGMPARNAVHDVPDRTEEQRELEDRRMGETT